MRTLLRRLEEAMGIEAALQRAVPVGAVEVVVDEPALCKVRVEIKARAGGEVGTRLARSRGERSTLVVQVRMAPDGPWVAEAWVGRYGVRPAPLMARVPVGDGWPVAPQAAADAVRAAVQQALAQAAQKGFEAA